MNMLRQKGTGAVGFYRRLCRNFPTVVALLTELLKAKVKICVVPRMSDCFWKCEGSNLNTAAVLAPPQWDTDFKIKVDASDVGAGAVLLQCDNLGVHNTVSFLQVQSCFDFDPAAFQCFCSFWAGGGLHWPRSTYISTLLAVSQSAVNSWGANVILIHIKHSYLHHCTVTSS